MYVERITSTFSLFKNYRTEQSIRYRKPLINSGGIVFETLILFNSQIKYTLMLRWAVIFFIVAIIAAVFGFTGIAAGAVSIARILFWIFVVLFLLSLIGGYSMGKKGE